MIRPAFTLIEVLASVVILSLLAVTLLTTMRLASRSGDRWSPAAAAVAAAVAPDRLASGKDLGDLVIRTLPADQAVETARLPAVRWVEVRARSGDPRAVSLRLLAGEAQP